MVSVENKIAIYKEFIDLFQTMLDSAIEFEHYEDAAELRDTIQELKMDMTLVELGLNPLEEINIIDNTK